ncbi:MAG: GAF domain-containing sensor histidine kinase [Dehalococcoidales bacterium]|nr:MAG: GAF domain-containing sensor histidine kinase [Dehalococcoidales bacterium]
MVTDNPDNSEVQTPEEEIQKQQHELVALSRVSAALSGLWELDAILRVALDTMLDVMNGTIGGILLMDEETQSLAYRVHTGLSTRYVEEMQIGPGEGISGRVAESGKAILLEDISADPRVARPDLITTEGLKAFISVPLRAKDAVLGVINIASRTPRRFTTSDLYLLHSMGDQLGVAIEQSRLYERLRKARERYRQLAQQTLVAQEEERRRIARELHDETSQVLSGLALQLQALVDMAEMSGTQDAEFISGLKKVQSLAAQVHGDISKLIADLRPALLDTLGLIPAIRQYAETSLRPLDINVDVETIGVLGYLPPEVEAGLYRWTQGAIGNIAQHSRAKNASIVLEHRDDELLLTVSDDGQGFDVSEITDIEPNGRGRGVFSMKERVGLLGGTCSIDSSPGQGTNVRARVPLSWHDEDGKNKGTGSR